MNRTLLFAFALATIGCFAEVPPVPEVAETDEPGPPNTNDGTPVLPGETTGDVDTTSANGETTETSSSDGATDSGDEPPRCGDGTVNEGEDCDDGNDDPGDGCDASCAAEDHACADGIATVGEDLAAGIGVCKDTSDSTCEQDFATLCAPGWHLCSGTEHVQLNDDTIIELGEFSAVGVIRCRALGGSGHYTSHDFNVDGPDSCEIGSSRTDCPTNLGCNEGMHAALCCAPIDSCGNGQVDDPREECDDGNDDDLDGCSNACANRYGAGPHC
jgi:cysteine-rich repeat protein